MIEEMSLKGFITGTDIFNLTHPGGMGLLNQNPIHTVPSE